MKRPSPILHITFALTLLGCAVLIMAQWMWNLFPDPREREAGWRQAHAESATAQVLFLLERNLTPELQRTLELAAKADARIRSIGIRRSDGSVMVQTREHVRYWHPPADGRSTLTDVVVPISTPSARWGQLEMSFEPEAKGVLAMLAKYPLAIALGHFALVGALLYWLYLRRAMVLLDPSAVIPERIRAAYDVMTEGVALLDARGRILMVNTAFHGLPPSPWPDVVGKKLSSLPWLAAGLPADSSRHPWALAMRSGQASSGHELCVGTEAATARRLILNCAPIADRDGRPRGCIVTFDDVSALQRTNEQLAVALSELQSSKLEIERKNLELEKLASHDNLSGCLTRGAGLVKGEALLDAAVSQEAPLSCMLIDIDSFKSVNDSYGHAKGDQMIRLIGQSLVTTLEDPAVAVRHGGDEFVAFVPGHDLKACHRLAEQLRADLHQRSARLAVEELAPHVTVSIGVAQWDGTTMQSLADLIAAADEALYEAKAQGRNCVRSMPAAHDSSSHSAASTGDSDINRTPAPPTPVSVSTPASDPAPEAALRQPF